MIKQIFTLNEKKYIESILKNKYWMLTERPKATLDLLAQYYYDVENIRKKGITEKLIAFLKDRYPKYNENPKYWDSACESIAKTTGGISLFECSGIPVTEQELIKMAFIEAPAGMDDKALHRLLFTILVVGKYQRMRNPKNHYGYINIKTIDLFQLARVNCNQKERLMMLNALYNLGLIGYPKSGNDNCRPTFIDDDSKGKVFITDLREIGYQYNKMIGGTYFKCKKCGKLIKPNSANAKNKLCKECADTANITTARCVDCGKLFAKDVRAAVRVRCADCQKKRNTKAKKDWKNRKVNTPEKPHKQAKN